MCWDIDHECETNRLCEQFSCRIDSDCCESRIGGLLLIRDCCPIVWTLERAKTKIQLKRPLSCETCTVNRAFCDAFCRGDERAVQYALILEDLMVMEGGKDVRKEIGSCRQNRRTN